MKQSGKVYLSIGLLCAACFSMTSCTKSQPVDSEGNVIVKMSLMNSTNENPGWLAMIDAANEVLKKNEEKVRIEPEIIKTDSWDEYYTKITSNMVGRIGGTIGRIAESHIPLMVDKNQLADVSAIRDEFVAIKDDEGNPVYNADAFEGVAEKNGKYYGLPCGTQHMVLYYNKTIFDRYNRVIEMKKGNESSDKIIDETGLSQERIDEIVRGNPDLKSLEYPSGDWENASTFTAIKDMAKKLSGGSGASRRFGLSAGPFLAYAGMYAKNSGGENIFNAAGECMIKSQPFYDVYAWFDEMLKTDRSMPTTSDTATSSAFDRFLTGNIAMMIDGVWNLHDIVKYTEDYEIGVAAIPVKSSGYTSYTTTFTDRFWAARNSSTPEQDQIALRALLSAEAINAVGEKQVGGFPIRKDSIDIYLSSLSGTKLKDYVNVIKEGTDYSVNVPYSTYYNIVDQRINQKMSVWINGEMTSVQFVDYMDESMRLGMEGKL